MGENMAKFGAVGRTYDSDEISESQKQLIRSFILHERIEQRD